MNEKLAISGDIPQSRFGHTITQISKNIVILFGGATGDSGKYNITADVFSCDLSICRWRRLYPSGNGPTNRAAHCSVAIDNNNKVVIFGGAVGGGGLADDNLYVLDLSQGEDKTTWMNIPIVGSTPGRRYGHTMVFIKPYLVVFGGNTGSEPVNDTWSLNLEKAPFNWQKLEVSGDLPQVRVYHSAALCTTGAANGMMVIFGGRTSDQISLNDTWGLRRHRDGRWDWVKAPYKSNIELPIPRYQHSTIFQGPLMFVIGGRSNSMQVFQEIYDTETSDWHKFQGISRFRHSIWIMDNSLYMHGGFDSESPNIPTDSIIRSDLTKVLSPFPNLIKQMLKQVDKYTNQPVKKISGGMEIEEKTPTNAGQRLYQQQQQQYTKPIMVAQQKKEIRLAADAVIAFTYDPTNDQDSSIQKKVQVNKLNKQNIKLSKLQIQIIKEHLLIAINEYYIFLSNFNITSLFTRIKLFILDSFQNLFTICI